MKEVYCDAEAPLVRYAQIFLIVRIEFKTPNLTLQDFFMATWQYDLHLIPRSSVLQLFGVTPSQLTRSLLDQRNWWLGYELPQNIGSMMGLGEGKSWSVDIDSWGEDDSDRIDVLKEDGVIEEVFIRLDVRNIDNGFVDKVIDLANNCDCLLLTNDGYLIEPSIEQLMVNIRSSKAFQFVFDTRVFFKNLED